MLADEGNKMQHNSILIIALLFSASIYAEKKELERSTITTCAYQAGTAREIQTIRQSEGDDWLAFELNIKKIYKDGQGRTDLLAIAKTVYLQPERALPIEVYDNAFSICVKRIQGTEAAA